MSSLVVGIGDCKVSRNPEDVIITHALGSCIGITIHDPIAKVAGLLHYMLPDASLDAGKAAERPCMFADTGIQVLLNAAYRLGAVKSRLVVTAAGGAQMLEANGSSSIGKRNHLAMRKLLWKSGVLVHKEEIGGKISRTLSVEVASGRVQLHKPGETDQVTIPNSTRIGAGNGLQYSHRR